MSNLFSKVIWKIVRDLHLEKKLSDEQFLKLKFKVMMNERLDLKNPKTFNQKIQWLKMNNRKKEYSNMVDKYEAKKYVKNIVGEAVIIPTYGVWSEFDSIPFEELPNQFVLKCTHDSGGLIVVKDKSKFDVEKAKIKIEKSLKNNFFYNSREWPYKNVKPRIIAEKYMTNGENGLTDYKFYCFNGEPKYLYVSEGMENHETAIVSFLDINWQKAKFGRYDYLEYSTIPNKPKNFSEMIRIAKILSRGHAFLRVDLYEIEGKVYFSELTFSPCGGYMPFKPKSWDETLGELIDLSLCKEESGDK